ncbi:MAG TPA: class I adenylate-forming enzyme family protein [Candidatus Udaeobacter sp.]|jgi:acyl-CoA synthetase (AMP-forming)/AMP-acid ligase II|nr:class I adenylate-forming enzyme family protein [Candidatus Udaeobacter sp.]
MKSSDPLLQDWEKTLARKRDAPAIFATSGEVLRTFADVEQRARDLLQSIDVFHEGNVLAVQIGNHEDWPAILIGCLRRHLVVLPLEQSMSEHQRDEALKICKVKALVSAVPGGGSPEIVRLGTADCTPDWRENPPNLLKLTSGTTATPRAIRFRSKQLLADCNQICDTMGISDVDLNFGVIPISHSYGFSNLLTPLIARAVPMVISRDRTPRAILGDLARSNATVFPGMPVFYQAFCEMEHVPVLPKLRLCISAGAPLPVATAKGFRKKFNLPTHSFYGASECGGICYNREAANRNEGFVGAAMNGVNLELVDPQGSASQIHVHSAAVGDGYFPESDEGKLGNGIFVPDDLLARDGSGFKIVGRISDVINVAGKKVNPVEVEAHLLRFTGVRQAIVFGRESVLRNQEVAACVVAAPDISETDLLKFCRGALSSWQVPKRIFIVDAVPANERGKISRRELSQRFSTSREGPPLP